MKKKLTYSDNISNKFWEINLTGKKVKIIYGRIGIKNPANQLKVFKSSDDAKKYSEKKIREKKNKGYI